MANVHIFTYSLLELFKKNCKKKNAFYPSSSHINLLIFELDLSFSITIQGEGVEIG